MAAKGSAAKSASGASMSKYDVEVEALPKCHHDSEEGDTDRLSALETKVENLIAKYKNHFGDLD